MLTRRARAYVAGLAVAGLAAGLVWAAAATTTASNDYGTFTVETGNPKSNDVNIKFKPKPTVECDKIVFIQTVRRTLSNGGDVVMKPGDYFPGWKFKDKNVTSDGTSVDHVSTEADPYYNGDDSPEDSGQQGHNNGSGSQDAEMHDDPASNGYWPPGKTKIRWDFETCAFCAAGPQAGTVYGCVTWSVTETKGAGPGTATCTSGTEVKDPSKSWQEAVDKFDENHIGEDGARHCPD